MDRHLDGEPTANSGVCRLAFCRYRDCPADEPAEQSSTGPVTCGTGCFDFATCGDLLRPGQGSWSALRASVRGGVLDLAHCSRLLCGPLPHTPACIRLATRWPQKVTLLIRSSDAGSETLRSRWGQPSHASRMPRRGILPTGASVPNLAWRRPVCFTGRVAMICPDCQQNLDDAPVGDPCPQLRIPTNPNGESRVSGRLASEAA